MNNDFNDAASAQMGDFAEDKKQRPRQHGDDVHTPRTPTCRIGTRQQGGGEQPSQQMS